MSRIIFDLPMRGTLLNHVNKINNSIKVLNMKTLGKKLPRWSFYTEPMGKNYNAVTLKRSKKLKGYYEIQNGRHRIAKLYLQGDREVKANIIN